MTAAIIIILIVIVIILAFQRDREKMLNKVESNGGLQEKYKIFLSLLTMNDGLKIVTVNKSCVLLRKDHTNVQMQLMLTQSFNHKVIITWKTVTALSTIDLNWEFPDMMDQKLMFAKIFDDISKRQEQELERIANRNDDFDVV